MSIEVEFVGGPLDGRRTRIEGEPLMPPGQLTTDDEPSPTESTTEPVYVRTTHANLVWRYQYDEPRGG